MAASLRTFASAVARSAHPTQKSGLSLGAAVTPRQASLQAVGQMTPKTPTVFRTPTTAGARTPTAPRTPSGLNTPIGSTTPSAPAVVSFFTEALVNAPVSHVQQPHVVELPHSSVRGLPVLMGKLQIEKSCMRERRVHFDSVDERSLAVQVREAMLERQHRARERGAPFCV